MGGMSDLHADAQRVASVHQLRNELVEASPLIRTLRELCGDDEQAFLDNLEGSTDVTEAVRAVVRWMAEQKAAEGSAKALGATYAARAGMYAARYERTKGALLDVLNELGVKSLPLPEATLTAKTLPPSLVGDVDGADLPDDLVRIKREPNKTAIKAALEAGRAVPGYLLSNGGQTLQVKQ